MKNFIRFLPVKILCFVLCVVCLITSLASVLGIVVMANVGFYTRSEQYFYYEFATNMINNDAYNIMYYVVNEAEGEGYGEGIHEIDHYYSFDETNVRYRVWSPEKEILYSNVLDSMYTEDSLWTYRYSYTVTKSDGYLYINRVDKEKVDDSQRIYTLELYLQDGLPIKDDYALASTLLHIVYGLRYSAFIIGTASLVLLVLCFIFLMCSAGRKPSSEEIHAGALNKVPFDVLIASIFCMFMLACYLVDSVFWEAEIALWIILCFLAIMVFLGLCVSVAVRLKQNTLFKNTLVWIVCKLIGRIVKWSWRKVKSVAGWVKELIVNLPLIWKTAALVTISAFIDFLIIMCIFSFRFDFDMQVLVVAVWIIKSAFVAAATIYTALSMKKLQKGGKALAEGDLAYKVDTKRMFWDFKRHGEDLNRISDGMAVAVEQRLKSERTKAELVTNVSHDIKTPLTSIINYASLICEEKCDNEKHAEYSRVLIRRSEHLKRLLEDLVEISKATTGNLEVQLMPCSAQVLLSQVAGEFEQRCIDAGLELVTHSPESNIMIMADSRRIWRVFENLMNNACKYSLSGSRVYITLEKIEGEAVFVFKNTSKSALNISPDELMERFVRGDTSRNTEGNGLGLSIASSLTQLQNGKMELTIDGDLFKVALRFPVI